MLKANRKCRCRWCSWLGEKNRCPKKKATMKPNKPRVCGWYSQDNRRVQLAIYSLKNTASNGKGYTVVGKIPDGVWPDELQNPISSRA